MKVFYVCEFSVQLDAAVRKIRGDPFRVVHECILEFEVSEYRPLSEETEKVLKEHGLELVRTVEIIS